MSALRIIAGIPITAALLAPAICQAQAAPTPDDKPDLIIMVGTGGQIAPKYPGSGSVRPGFLPVVEVWREGESLPVETPDEAFGFALVGERGKTSFGPAIAFSTSRSANSGFPRIKGGVELGGFAEHYVTPGLRLRSEVRQAVGGHRGLLADFAVDAVIREDDDRLVATIGPRLRWGDAKFQNRYFGIESTTAGPPGFGPYRPGSGIYAMGVQMGTHYQISDRVGLYGFAGYERYVGDAAQSPVVRQGSRNQPAAGLAITYRFRVKR